MLLLMRIIDQIFLLYTIMMFVRILGSWLPDLQQYRFMQFIAFYTDPYFNFFRRFIPPLGMIDLSPIAAFFCLVYLIEPLTKSLVYSIITLLTP